MFSVLFLFVTVASDPPAVTIEPTANGYIAEVPPFDARYQNQIDAEIDGRAAEICQNKIVRWGEFKSDVRIGKPSDPEPPRVSGFSRAFSCTRPIDRNFAAAPSDWKPAAADEADVRRIFQSYYARRDAGDFRAARAMFSPEAVAEDSSWPKQMAEFNEQVGTGTRRIASLTWYVNPDSAPHPGVYVAVDFVGDFAGTHFYCGYIVLFRTAPGTYEITREEQNRFDRNDEQVDPAQLSQMRAAMCRDE